MSDLHLDNNTICIFFDESGVFTTPPADPVFCVGACVLHSAQITSINNKFEEKKYEIFGNKKYPFHASSDEVKRLPNEDKQKIYDFLKIAQIGRIGVGYNKAFMFNKNIMDKRQAYMWVVQMIHQRALLWILKWYPVWYPFNKIVIIFEDSEKDRQMIQDCFGTLSSYNVDGAAIEPEFYFMPKIANFPCLELADIIANATYQELRRRYEGKNTTDFSYGFKNIYHSVDPRLSYFFDMREVDQQKS